MPIEIRELVIRAHIEPDDHRSTTNGAVSGSTNDRQQEDLIRACVQEVLRILEDKRER